MIDAPFLIAPNAFISVLERYRDALFVGVGAGRAGRDRTAANGFKRILYVFIGNVFAQEMFPGFQDNVVD